jgi:hypothetical protein
MTLHILFHSISNALDATIVSLFHEHLSIRFLFSTYQRILYQHSPVPDWVNLSGLAKA